MERPETELWQHPGVVLAVIALLLVLWSVWDGIMNSGQAYREFLQENEERSRQEQEVQLDEHESKISS